MSEYNVLFRTQDANGNLQGIRVVADRFYIEGSYYNFYNGEEKAPVASFPSDTLCGVTKFFDTK